jgi:hypothetical protein
VLEGHDRTVYSVTWGTGKPGTTETGGESLGWVASTGGDGRINVWALEVSRYYVALLAWRVLSNVVLGTTGLYKKKPAQTYADSTSRECSRRQRCEFNSMVSEKWI